MPIHNAVSAQWSATIWNINQTFRWAFLDKTKPFSQRLSVGHLSRCLDVLHRPFASLALDPSSISPPILSDCLVFLLIGPLCSCSLVHTFRRKSRHVQKVGRTVVSGSPVHCTVCCAMEIATRRSLIVRKCLFRARRLKFWLWKKNPSENRKENRKNCVILALITVPSKGIYLFTAFIYDFHLFNNFYFSNIKYSSMIYRHFFLCATIKISNCNCSCNLCCNGGSKMSHVWSQ